MSETTEEELQQQQESPSPQEMPGHRLGQAREAAGLTRSEIASRMRLNEKSIAALEEDNYDAFPSATFVSGYFRSYARILGLNEEEFVKPVSNDIEPPGLVSTIGSKEQTNSQDLPVRMVTYLLVLAVLVSVVMWWYSQRSPGETVTAQPDSEVVNSGEDVGLAVPEAPSAPVDEPSPAEAEGADTIENAETGQASSNMPEPTEQATTSEAASVSETETQPSASEEETAEAEPEPSPEPITEATPVSRLELRYQADSWTEVKDSAGRSLAYGLIKAGQTVELKGEAPFRVFLGYAPGVMVYYNGDLFDHSPFQRRDVARFRIGRAEHNVPGSR